MIETRSLFDAAAQDLVAGQVNRLARQFDANPKHHRVVLAKLGLDMLAPRALVARAAAMLEQELARKTRGAFEFGRALDLRAIIALAEQEMAHG